MATPSQPANTLDVQRLDFEATFLKDGQVFVVSYEDERGIMYPATIDDIREYLEKED